jgi:hypothetical protein
VKRGTAVAVGVHSATVAGGALIAYLAMRLVGTIINKIKG